MATKKPLVLSNGKVEQLQSGDTLDGVSATIPGFIYGLTAANNTADATNDIDFAAGYAWVGDRIIQNASTFTKRLDAAWAAGSGNGGLFSGSKISSTWYHCFALKNSITHEIDFGFDTSVTAANKPAGYDARIIWSVLTDGSGTIRPFAQSADFCVWKTPIADVGNATIASGTSLITVSSPLGLSCPVTFTFYTAATSTNYAYLSSPLSDDLAANYIVGRIDVQASAIGPMMVMSLLTNMSSQIRINTTASLTGSSVSTRAFQHLRGR